MATRNWLTNGLVVSTVVFCLTILGCSSKKGHCSKCENDDDCSSGECATFISNNGNKSLLCGNGSSFDDSCSVPN